MLKILFRSDYYFLFHLLTASALVNIIYIINVEIVKCPTNSSCLLHLNHIKIKVAQMIKNH